MASSASAVQKLKIESDKFSFGISAKIVALIFIIAALICGALCWHLMQDNDGMVAVCVTGFMFIVLCIGSMNYFYKSFDNDWLPCWEVDKDGIRFYQTAQTKPELTLLWSDITDIDLYDLFVYKGSPSKESRHNKVVVITASHELSGVKYSSRFKKYVFQTITKNQIIRNYSGATQTQLKELLETYAQRKDICHCHSSN